MDLSEIEILYSPSWWNKRKSPEEICEYFAEYVTSESTRIKKIIPCELDVPYGENDRQELDIYGTHLPNDSPVLIFIHGGFWQEGSKAVAALLAETLAGGNIKTIGVGFNLCPKVTLQEQIKEVENGIKKSLELACKWGSKVVALAGHSSGAHVIAALLTDFLKESTRNVQLIKKIFLICGIYDIKPLVNTYINDLLNLSEDEAKLLSPLYKDIVSKNMHVLCVTVDNEAPSFIKDTENIYEKLKKTDNTVEIVHLENLDHFDVIEKLTDSDFTLSKMIMEILNK